MWQPLPFPPMGHNLQPLEMTVRFVSTPCLCLCHDSAEAVHLQAITLSAV